MTRRRSIAVAVGVVAIVLIGIALAFMVLPAPPEVKEYPIGPASNTLL